MSESGQPYDGSMRTRFLLLLSALVLASCAGSPTTAPGVVEVVSVDDAAAVLADHPDAIVLDIRTPEEFATGWIPGAINIDFYAADFGTRLRQLDRDATYVVYCRSGNRTGQALDTFRQLGFASVHAVDGGILSWFEAGRPMVLP